MDAEAIADKARKSIGRFCIEECRSFCCRKCYLVLEEDEVDVVTQGRKAELEAKGLLKRLASGKHSLNMGTSDMACPSLDTGTFRCRIHRHPKRPKTCSNFPLFIEGKNIMLSPRCLAVRLGMLYPFIARLKMMGYTIIKPEEYSDIELYSTELINPKGPTDDPGVDIAA
jgi:Fe-S-cluster containining protein